MPWPEKTLVDRLLAAAVGAILGALFGFIFAFGIPSLIFNAEPPLLAIVAWGAAIGFIAGHWIGDPAIRFMLWLIGRGGGIG